MHYIIYKTTNLVNNKIYIGMHMTKNINDGYKGSGKLLKAAMKKYGKDCFKTEILYELDTYEEMVAKEKELVTIEFCLNNQNYNLGVGGKGGIIWIVNPMQGKRQSNKQKIKARATMKNMMQNNPDKIYDWARKGGLKGGPKAFKGKRHTDEWKENHSNIMKVKQSGKDNSQYGSMWITDGIISKKISKTESIPEGWSKGRKMPS